jgi:hypothetical protein
MRCLMLFVCGWLTVPALASAGEAVPDARVLGLAEAMLNYCAKADPPAAAGQRERIKHLVGDASWKTLVAVRHSPEYRQAYDSETDFVGMVASHNVHRLCSGSLSRSR